LIGYAASAGERILDTIDTSATASGAFLGPTPVAGLASGGKPWPVDDASGNSTMMVLGNVEVSGSGVRTATAGRPGIAEPTIAYDVYGFQRTAAP